MKKILVIAYILIVASLSITARAEMDIPLLINSIHHDQQARLFQVSGQFPNPCIVNPSPVLLKNQKGQLVLDIVGESTSEACISLLGPQFMIAIDLNLLKTELSNLQLDDNATYNIFDSRGQLIDEIDFSKIFHAIPFKPTTLSGTLTVEKNSLYIEGPLGVRIEVKSQLQNMHNLHNEDVILTGHMMTHSVSQPIFKTNNNIAAPQFIATGVSYLIID